VSLLEFKDVCKRVRDGAREILVLDDVSVGVHESELIGVYGERRAGKSTLLRIAAGLEAPSSGTVRFGDTDLGSLSGRGRARLRRRGGVALVSCERAPLLGGQPAVEHVALPLTSDGLTMAESEALAHAALEQVGASALSHLCVDALSLGDRIRVELARALVREPKLLLIDEPALLPGPTEARELHGLLRGLPKSHGAAVVIVSQDMTALAGVQRFFTLTDGRLRGTESRRRVIPFPGARAGAAGP
jgi:predicted ABC-type transport system involved in lysophospholipase L1 biosynthesis ATPase subunit